ncbi:MAG: hypothetical protein D6704_04430 [Nitrospirae bacterium]|nr:MAG: hypothetical protein D6704_04430 [Nitrospirota bacterium]
MKKLRQDSHHLLSTPEPYLSSTCPHRALLAAVLSLCIPGLGFLYHGQFRHALTTGFVGVGLVGFCWILGLTLGTGAAVFAGLLVVLPWWCLQVYASTFYPTSGFWDTCRRVWREAHDIRYLGGLFFLTGFMDLYIIMANPEYALTLFCTKPAGLAGILAKAQSPTLHLAIGYGFLRLRLWALWLYLVYAGFGLINATVNFACLGYGRIRTVFLVTLLAFTAYVIWRRRCFYQISHPPPRHGLKFS